MTGEGRGPWRWLALLLFGYVLARPVSNNHVLVPVLGVIGLLAAGTVLVTRRRLDAAFVPALLITFLFALVGLASGPTNPGFTGAVLVFIAAPLLWWTCAVAVDERTMRGLFTTAAVVTVFVGGTIALYVAQNTGALPALLPGWLLEQYGAGYGELSGSQLGGADYTEVRFYALSTLVATGPMWIGSLFVTRDRLLPPWWLRALAAAAATAGALSGGRRAIALVMVLAPVLLWALRWAVARAGAPTTPGRGGPLLLVGGLAGLLALVFDPGLLGRGVVGAALNSLSSFVTGRTFVGASAGEDQIRVHESEVLLRAWSEAPLFGHGLGATISGYWRDPVEPWRWELQYHGLLLQTGVVGVLLVLLGAAATAAAVLRAVRARPDLTPSLLVACTGAAGMLIGNASNPYLQAPGHVWAIFLPVAVANLMLRSAQRPPGADRDLHPTPVGAGVQHREGSAP